MMKHKIKDKLRIKVEPVGLFLAESTQNFVWSLEVFSEDSDLFGNPYGIKKWRVAYNWDEKYSDGIWPDYKTFSGYCTNKDEGILKAKEAAKEYCRQRKEFREKKEYIAKNIYVEEISCEI